MDDSVRTRARTAADLPDLVDLVDKQQPASRYPYRWPLPFPVEDFLVRPGELETWVAEDDGGLLGHVSLTRAEVDEHAAAWAEGIGRPADELAVVSVLVVAQRARRRGIGRMLIGGAVRRSRELGLQPVLDVVPVNAAALAMYRAMGWVELSRARASWQPEDAPDLVLMTLPGAPQGEVVSDPPGGSSRSR